MALNNALEMLWVWVWVSVAPLKTGHHLLVKLISIVVILCMIRILILQ